MERKEARKQRKVGNRERGGGRGWEKCECLHARLRASKRSACASKRKCMRARQTENKQTNRHTGRQVGRQTDRRTPWYHHGPMRVIFTSSNPAWVNHSIYSASVGNNIHKSANHCEGGNVGLTGPVKKNTKMSTCKRELQSWEATRKLTYKRTQCVFW